MMRDPLSLVRMGDRGGLAVNLQRQHSFRLFGHPDSVLQFPASACLEERVRRLSEAIRIDPSNMSSSDPAGIKPNCPSRNHSLLAAYYVGN